MIIIGIDPGSTRIGYGIIKFKKEPELIDYGSINLKRGQKSAGELLSEVISELQSLIKKYQPELAAIEKLYFSKNVKTGIEVAQTRGAIISELAQKNILVKEFGPSEVKLTVAGYGLADKKGVAKMVKKILKIENLSGYDDASDALAIAITAAYNKR